MKVSNKHEASGLIPLGHAVLVEPYDPETANSVIALTEGAERGMKSLENRARIVAIGADAWMEEREPRAAVGDLVLLANFSGVLVKGPKDGKLYRMVNDRDIYCGFEV